MTPWIPPGISLEMLSSSLATVSSFLWFRDGGSNLYTLPKLCSAAFWDLRTLRTARKFHLLRPEEGYHGALHIVTPGIHGCWHGVCAIRHNNPLTPNKLSYVKNNISVITLCTVLICTWMEAWSIYLIFI